MLRIIPNGSHGRKESIGTADGEMFYYATEIEDKNGNWNQDYTIKDGFWLIHEGKYHHIYTRKGIKPSREAFE